MRESPFRSRPLLAGIAALLLANGSLALAGERAVTGTITSFQCGDNCYLTITSASGEEHVGLCAAPECAAWNEVAEMLKSMVGKDVVATVGVGTQFDGNGDPVGEMLAFEKIEVSE